ncbi:hypothetical protein BJ322DRAFT_1044765 [Thelephora terrestris]|uniref:Uncharacterized protein n=1 Tax=Thelephora terrestris TaxID=56493 RepID=A0A9P6HN55_9AGAM|nr:hypothetical protein BJ322DRAFT_1044765 [Thelephora terrestris]
MAPKQVKVVKCLYYNPETGDPDPAPCPRGSKGCWYIHPNEPQWDNKGKRLSSPPRRLVVGRKESLSSRIGRGRSRSRSRSRSRGRGKAGRPRSRSRSRSRSSGRYVSPSRRRPRRSSPPPPRRPLHERIQPSRSPRRPSPSRLRPRNSPPRHARDRRRTTTPISSSSGPTPPRDTKLDNAPRRVKVESPADVVPSLLSKSTHSVLSGKNRTVAGDQTLVRPTTSVDRDQQRPSLNLPLGEQATVTSDSILQPSPQVDPQSSIFAPETPVIPGLTVSADPTQTSNFPMSALQRSLEQVIRDQATTQVTDPSTTTPDGGPAVSHAATIPEAEKTEIWTTRVKLWADLMKAKSEVMDWQDEVKMAQSYKNRAGYESFSPEARAQVDARVTYATTNLVQHQLAFEAIVSQSIALDRNVSKTYAALAPAPPDTRAATAREIEWVQEKIQFATVRMDELEQKLALQDRLLEQIKAEQESLAAAPPPASSTPLSWSPMEVEDGDGVLDHTPPLKRKRADDDDPRPSSRRKSMARTIADLRKANETLVDRITEAEGAIDVILNDVVEDSEGEDLSRVTRLKEIVQDYQTFSESAKTAAEVTESNSRVVVALTTEAERALADWDEVYQEFEVVRKDAAEIDNRANGRVKEIKEKEEKITSMQREIEALNATVQAFVEQQSAQPEVPLTLEQVIQSLKPYLLEEMREATQPLLKRKHAELQHMVNEHIEAVRVSVYEPIRMSEQVAQTMVNWLEAEFDCGNIKRP